MTQGPSRQVIVAGGGIAGLTAALAFARRGFAVHLYERASRLDEVGAGLQLSPNATRLLRELGVLDALLPVAIRSDHVTLSDARSLAVLAHVKLGDFAERRWGAPYLVVHRADLQKALLARAADEAGISIATGASVNDFAVRASGVTVSIDRDGKAMEEHGRLLVGADGVWSRLRSLIGAKGRNRFSGSIAWRATIPMHGHAGEMLGRIASAKSVSVFVHPAFHLILYPLRGGDTLNLVVVTRGQPLGESWSGQADAALLGQAVEGSAKQIRELMEAIKGWTVWPIHTADVEDLTLGGSFALIGDAAHAMTPFAAQGAAMAIEDAVTLADTVAAAQADAADALAAWAAARRTRISKVVRRGRLNRFAWHAAGPVALARNLFLKSRSPEQLAADLDWLYGWRMTNRDKSPTRTGFFGPKS